MVNINTFKIDDFGTNILVDVSVPVGQLVTTAKIWKSSDYKSNTTYIDVSDLLLNQSEVENFTIPAEKLGLSYISGLYIAEFTSDEVIATDECCNSNNATGVIANFVQYEECILNKAMSAKIDGCNQLIVSGCESCGDNLLYASMFLSSLHAAVRNGFYNEANTIITQLNETCEICNTCPTYENTQIVNGTGYGTVNNTIILV
tara:strand:- start:1824 stop:2432 length:609 start_codon:yes stop_codon:yes gene_type:complete